MDKYTLIILIGLGFLILNLILFFLGMAGSEQDKSFIQTYEEGNKEIAENAKRIWNKYHPKNKKP